MPDAKTPFYTNIYFIKIPSFHHVNFGRKCMVNISNPFAKSSYSYTFSLTRVTYSTVNLNFKSADLVYYEYVAIIFFLAHLFKNIQRVKNIFVIFRKKALLTNTFHSFFLFFTNTIQKIMMSFIFSNENNLKYFYYILKHIYCYETLKIILRK